MAHVLVTTVPIAGHVQPFIRVVRALVARGHEVHWYTGKRYEAAVTAAGARHEPYVRCNDFDDHQMETSFPARAHRSGLGQLKHDLHQVFLAAALHQLADIEVLTGHFRPDVILADPLLLGALLYREKTGVPLVLINVVGCPVRSRDTAPFGLGILPRQGWLGSLRNRALNVLVDQLLLRDVQLHWQRIRRAAGLGTARQLFDAVLDASLFLQPTVAGFEYPRSDLPGNVRLVGALHPDPMESLPRPDYYDEIGPSTRLVHVTQGTMSNVRPDLIEPALLGLADEPVLVIVATGGRTASELGLTRVPKNARIVPFVSYPELLPRTSVMVTNGGYGGVQLALSFGVPLVVWGTSEDKPEVAARVAWSGAGVRLSRFGRPSAREVRDAVKRLLIDPSYSLRARALAEEYGRSDAVACVVELIEGLVTPRVPS